MRWFRRDHCHCGKIWLDDNERFLAGDDNRTVHERDKCFTTRAGVNWCQCGCHYLGAEDSLYDHDTLLRHRRRPNHCETKLPEAFDPDPYWPDFPPLQHCPHGYIVSQGAFVSTDQILHTRDGCEPIPERSTVSTTPDPADPKPGDRFRWRDYPDPVEVRYVDAEWVFYMTIINTPYVVSRQVFADHASVAPQPLITEPVKLYRTAAGAWLSGAFHGYGQITVYPDGTWTSDD